MNDLVFGVAQMSVIKGNIQQNLARHCQLIKAAAQEGVQLLLFPELSLTGYEPNLAQNLAIEVSDENLFPLQELANQYAMVLLVGAPNKTQHKPEIGLFIIRPHQAISCYSKLNLHASEELFFARGTQHQTLELNEQKFGLAICADIANSEHIEMLMKDNIAVYLAGVLISENGLSEDCKILENYVIKHNILVAMANFTGETGGWSCAGNSTIWNSTGEILARANHEEFAVVIASRENSKWSGKTITIK